MKAVVTYEGVIYTYATFDLEIVSSLAHFKCNFVRRFKQ